MPTDVNATTNGLTSPPDGNRGKLQPDRKRPPLPWNNKSVVGIELKSHPVHTKPSDSKASQLEPTANNLKPCLVTPRLARTRLPWIDGISPSFRSGDRPRKASVPGGFASDGDVGVVSTPYKPPPLPTAKSGPKKFARANIALRSVGSSPSLRRKPTEAPLKRRISSVTSTGLVPSRRKSLKPPPEKKMTQGDTTLALEEPSQPLAPQSLQSARTSMVVFKTAESTHPVESPASEDVFVDITDQIDEASTPGKQKRIFPLTTTFTSQSEQLSTRRGRRTPHHQRIDDATEVFENLVDEAGRLVEDAANHGKFEEVSHIVQDATETASTIRARHLMAVGEPLKVSTPTLESSSETSSSGSFSISSRLSQGMLRRAAPPEGSSYRHDRNHVVIHVRKPHQMENIVSESSPNSPTGPSTIDWAYVKKKGQREKSSSSSSSTNSSFRRRSRSREIENGPYEPERIGSRVGFVDDSHPGRVHRRRHRRHRSSGDSGRQHKPVSKATSHIQSKRSSYYDPSEDSFDSDEDEFGLPNTMTESCRFSSTSPHPRNLKAPSLKVRDQVRAHRYSVHRHSRHQSIARNWSTSKKRITATIACLNTSLLGIIVGIYVSFFLLTYRSFD
jgi:hypothetical protein